jgi:hypothetical protein
MFLLVLSLTFLSLVVNVTTRSFDDLGSFWG